MFKIILIFVLLFAFFTNVSGSKRTDCKFVRMGRMMGLLYLPFVAHPSFVGSGLDYGLGINNHDEEWYEVNANRMTKRYLKKHEKNALDPAKGGTPWNSQGDYLTKYKFNWYTIPSILLAPALALLFL